MRQRSYEYTRQALEAPGYHIDPEVRDGEAKLLLPVNTVPCTRAAIDAWHTGSRQRISGWHRPPPGADQATRPLASRL